ncbi:MAG TPA: hypothetical protein VFW17_03545 [Ktedonobacterales bacterium]|nr:hypothetical protein [Ktedonobacterales bacterium]
MQNLPNNASTWPQQQSTSPQPPASSPERMPPEKARRRAKTLKRLTLAGTTLTFCALAGLAANHVTGVTSANAAGASATATPSHQDDHGRFFPGDGRGSDDDGQQNGQDGGYNFGPGSGTFQPPASSSGGS